MLRVLTLSTLFPDATRPNFGVFVERQTIELTRQPDTQVRVIAPIGLPPFPLDRLARYRAFRSVPPREDWKGLAVERPRFIAMPGMDGRLHPHLLKHALQPVMRRLRSSFPFDVIDASFFFPDGLVAVDLGREFGVPVSIKARGADIHYWGQRPATARFVREAGQRADGLLAVSEAMRHDMSALGIAAERIRVHHTGVDQGRFTPDARTAGKGEAAQIVSVGALIPRKGHDILIEAVALLPGIRLAIAGDGPDRARLAGLIDRLNINDRVELLGPVPHDALPALLANADVMALASGSEGLANAWVEALACGTPIVISDAGGAREVIDRPEAGRIAARTPEGFADAIRAVLAAAPARTDVRETAARFSWERNASTLRAHLAALVEARR